MLKQTLDDQRFQEREEFERQLARFFGIELRRQFRNVRRTVGDSLGGELRDEFWNAETSRISIGATPILLGAFLASASQLLSTQPIAIEWGIINDRGAQWASEYSFELVKGINATTRATLQREIANAQAQGLGFRDLRGRLANTFGPVRADMIATTETTRAAIQGQREFIDEVEKLGVRTQASWLTAQDERVCPICVPLNGVKRAAGGYQHPSGMVFRAPPAHVRCRCDEIFEVIEDA